MVPHIYYLDLIGTFAFASFGAYVALKKKCNFYGICVAALLTAVGGGTLRELILGNVPFFLLDNNYVIAGILGCAFSIIFYPRFEKVNNYMVILDALGIATFAFIGAAKAADAGLGLFATIFLAMLSALAGGVIRDAAISDKPLVLYQGIYPLSAVFLGTAYWAFSSRMSDVRFAYPLIGFTAILRIIAYYSGVNLWVPWKKKVESLAASGKSQVSAAQTEPAEEN